MKQQWMKYMVDEAKEYYYAIKVKHPALKDVLQLKVMYM